MNKLEPFAKLFRKYRLRSEFETLNEFGDALADYNLVYENSIFSHWQKGTRTPKDRSLVFSIIKIFSERKGLTSLEEANQVMSSTGLGYLTDGEIQELTLEQKKVIPFQAPRRPEIFIGRENILEISKKLLLESKTVILTGQPGVGKTSVATEVAHTLRDEFPDGVIWCNCNTSSPLAILHEIATTFNETLPLHANEKQASILYRSFISSKKALFIFDGLSNSDCIELLLPNSSKSSVLITTQHCDPEYEHIGYTIPLKIFSKEETQILYNKLLTETQLKSSKKELEKLGREVGYLPLALHILTKQIAFKSLSAKKILQLLNEESEYFPSLNSSFNVCFTQLPKTTQVILKACMLFDGSNFSLEALQTMTSTSAKKITEHIQLLVQYSLLSEAHSQRYQLNPLFNRFLKRKQLNGKYLQNLASFYISFIKTHQSKDDFFIKMSAEVEIIINTLRKCIEYQYFDSACELWQLFGSYYWHVGAWEDFKDISFTIYNLAKENNKKELLLSICLEEVSRLYYYDGNIPAAIERASEAAQLADTLEDPYWKGLAHQRYGKLCFMNNDLAGGFKHLQLSESIFSKIDNYEYLSHNFRYLSEGYVIQKKYKEAKNLLEKSYEYIEKISSEPRQKIYASVILSHLGMLEYMKKNYQQAKEYFELGLKTNAKQPLVRGTYTWLNKMGLALTYHKLNYLDEAQDLLGKAQKEMRLLGIETSYPVINVYAAAIAPELKGLI